MNINAMYIFKGINQFNTFSNFTEQACWKIEKQLLKERVEKYKTEEFFLKLEHDFNIKKLTIWELKQEEVITWIDTILLLRRILLQLFKRGVNVENINIIMEYPLVFGNHMRSDYLIIYDRLIVVLEFGMFNQDEKRSEERYTKKLQESINYRQIISNSVDSSMCVINYVMIYRPEYDRAFMRDMTENIAYNNGEIDLLSKFLMLNIKKQDELTALKQLEIVNLST
ncbi:MAG: hypothetical protein K9L02_04440 [Acholeplasmataceae bacterium]|nr:hypothetical protein [Acholeplasmataceae bacterium]